VKILQLTVEYLSATKNRKTRNAEPDIVTDWSSHTGHTPRLDRYGSRFVPPRLSGSGCWPGLKPNRPVLAGQTWTAANTIHAVSKAYFCFHERKESKSSKWNPPTSNKLSLYIASYITLDRLDMCQYPIRIFIPDRTHHQFYSYQFIHATYSEVAIEQAASAASKFIPPSQCSPFTPSLCHTKSLLFRNTAAFPLSPNPLLCISFNITHQLRHYSHVVNGIGTCFAKSRSWSLGRGDSVCTRYTTRSPWASLIGCGSDGFIWFHNWNGRLTAPFPFLFILNIVHGDAVYLLSSPEEGPNLTAWHVTFQCGVWSRFHIARAAVLQG